MSVSPRRVHRCSKTESHRRLLAPPQEAPPAVHPVLPGASPQQRDHSASIEYGVAGVLRMWLWPEGFEAWKDAKRDTLSVCFYRNLGASAQLPASHRLHTSMLIQSSSRVHGTGTRNMTACAVRWHSGGAPADPRCEKVHSRVRLATPDALGIVPERCTPKL